MIRNLSECLMIQAKHLKIDDTLVTEIIKTHLGDLEKRNIKVICRALKAGTARMILLRPSISSGVWNRDRADDLGRHAAVYYP